MIDVIKQNCYCPEIGSPFVNKCRKIDFVMVLRVNTRLSILSEIVRIGSVRPCGNVLHIYIHDLGDWRECEKRGVPFAKSGAKCMCVDEVHRSLNRLTI